MLGGLGAGGGFAVVEGVALPDRRRGQVGHDHVGPGLHAQGPAPGVQGRQGRGGRQQHRRQRQPDQGQKHQRVLQRPRLLPAEGRVMLGQEGADAHHLGLQLLEQAEVLGQGLIRLPGRAHHKSGPHLVAQVFQCIEAIHSVPQTELRRVQAAVVPFVGGLMAQQIPPGSGLVPEAVDRLLPLPQGEGHGAVGIPGRDGRHGLGHRFRREARVLAALEDEGPKAPPVARLAAGENLLLRQPVAADPVIIPAKAAVIAVVFTDVGPLDQAPDIDLIPEPPLPLRPGQVKELRPVQAVPAGQQLPPLFLGEAAGFQQGLQQLIHGAAWRRGPYRRRRGASPPCPPRC